MTIEQYLAQAEQLRAVIVLLIAAVLVACGYLLTLPMPEPRAKLDPFCPLHRKPRSKCPPESHE